MGTFIRTTNRKSLFILLLCLYTTFSSFSQVYLSDNKNLTNQMKRENETYIVKKNINLNGGTIRLPAGASLYFQGGSFSNGIIEVDNFFKGIYGNNSIFKNIILRPISSISNISKIQLSEINASWFGAIGDNINDDTDALLLALESAHNLGVPLIIERGYYKITKPLRLFNNDIIKGVCDTPVDLANQQIHTVIRYYGTENSEIINISGKFVRIQNIILAVDKPYTSDGISCDGELIGLSLDNVLIGNAKYGINTSLGEKQGVSMCKFYDLCFANCIRGISVDYKKLAYQYITYNQFERLYCYNIVEKGVFLHANSINSTSFTNCLFTNVGYGTSCLDSYINTDIYSIEINNEGNQGGIYIKGGYFENQYYSKKGEIITNYDYRKNAVFSFRNINVTISDVRFANSNTVISSKGRDYIKIENCIDNGCISVVPRNNVICRENKNTMLSIDGYAFQNVNKSLIYYPINEKPIIKNLFARNIRLHDGSVIPSISFVKK